MSIIKPQLDKLLCGFNPQTSGIEQKANQQIRWKKQFWRESFLPFSCWRSSGYLAAPSSKCSDGPLWLPVVSSFFWSIKLIKQFFWTSRSWCWRSELGVCAILSAEQFSYLAKKNRRMKADFPTLMKHWWSRARLSRTQYP